MNQAAVALEMQASDCTSPAVIVVGNGPVGMRLANRLAQRCPELPIKVFGKENWTPYDRVGLSSFLAGQRSLEQLQLSAAVNAGGQIEMFVGRAIMEIDRRQQRVRDGLGAWHHYSHLFLATGSLPHVPEIPGTDLSGVFRFRDMKDALGLMARGVRTRHTVVIGGGLLGIEAARAMSRRGGEVTLIQHSDRLMNRQLDEVAAGMVQQRLQDAGVSVRLDTRVSAIIGDCRVTAVQLKDQSLIECDTVIFATGIRPNTDLARHAGLAVADGIRIDQHARTNDPLIFAGGECAQYEDEMFGLVAPGLEQASVAASIIAGDQASYTGSICASRLKVLDSACFSAGRVSDAWQHRVDRSTSWQDDDGQCYRRLYLERGRLVGALAVGPLPEQARLQSAIQQGTMIWPWQLWRFRRSGQLWPDGSEQDIASWPPTATVCQCRQVTRGELTQAYDQGCTSAAALSSATGAATVCGSCEPLLQNLCGNQSAKSGWQSSALVHISMVLVLLLATALWLEPVGYASSVEQIGIMERIWRDGLARQITGYVLLGLCVLAASLSLRKRWARLAFGRMPDWRVIHLVIGLLALVTLFLHTGMRMGSGSNLALMLVFLAIVIGGSLSGLLLGSAEKTPSPGRRKRAGSGVWLHIITLWPLPALLAAHVLKAYFF